VNNSNFWQANNDIAVQLDSCYFGVNATECAKYPSQVNITNITLENFHGTVDGQVSFMELYQSVDVLFFFCLLNLVKL
jgi:hypothetical protein